MGMPIERRCAWINKKQRIAQIGKAQNNALFYYTYYRQRLALLTGPLLSLAIGGIMLVKAKNHNPSGSWLVIDSDRPVGRR